MVAAGALGTSRLLIKCKETGSLPRLSERLGELVRTNSESILAVTLPDDSVAPWNDVAISASIHPSEDTHIEFCTYGKDADFMAFLLAPLTGNGTRLTRPLDDARRHRRGIRSGSSVRAGRSAGALARSSSW